MRLPNIDDTAKLWQEGIDKAKAELWRAFGEWFAESVHEQYRLFKESAAGVYTQLDALLDRRLQQSEEEYRQRLDVLDALQRHVEEVRINERHLRQTGGITPSPNEEQRA